MSRGQFQAQATPWPSLGNRRVPGKSRFLVVPQIKRARPCKDGGPQRCRLGRGGPKLRFLAPCPRTAPPAFPDVTFRAEQGAQGLLTHEFTNLVGNPLQGCMTISWLSGSKQRLRLPVGLPGLFKKDTAQGEKKVEISDIPTHTWAFHPCGRQLFAR